MTQEEIEKQSENYLKSKDWIWEQNQVMGNEVTQAFHDGAKWGMAHAIEWHDLRDNPNDLPKEKGHYWCHIDNEYFEHYGVVYFCDEEWAVDRTQVIVWCELPKYKE